MASLLRWQRLEATERAVMEARRRLESVRPTSRDFPGAIERVTDEEIDRAIDDAIRIVQRVKESTFKLGSGLWP